MTILDLPIYEQFVFEVKDGVTYPKVNSDYPIAQYYSEHEAILEQDENGNWYRQIETQSGKKYRIRS